MSKISLSPLHLATEMLLSVSCLFEATSIIDWLMPRTRGPLSAATEKNGLRNKKNQMTETGTGFFFCVLEALSEGG